MARPGGRPRRSPLVLGAAAAAAGTAAVLAWFVRSGRLEAVPWSPSVPLAVAVALLAHVAGHAVVGARMALLSRGALSWRRGWVTLTVGVFGAAATPARLGGEALKALMLRRTLPASNLTTLLVAERLFDLLVLAAAGLLVVAGTVQAVGVERTPVALPVAVVGLGLLAVAVWASSRFLRGQEVDPGTPGTSGPRWLRPLRDGLAALSDLPRPVVVGAAALTALAWSLAVLGFLASARVLGVPVGVADAAMLVLGVTLLQALPLLPSGVGTVDAYAVLVLPALGVEAGAAYVAWRSTVLGYDLVVGGALAAERLAAGNASRSTAGRRGGARGSVAQKPRHGVQDEAGDQ